MDADVGDRIQPDAGCRVDVIECNDLQAIEEIFFDVPHTVFDSSLFVALAHVAGRNGEAVIVGEIQVLGV